MMLGKRPRPPINRTTSMTEFTLDLAVKDDDESQSQPLDPRHPFIGGTHNHSVDGAAASPLPRTGRRHSADFLDTADHFLRACSLCKLRLIPGRDIYMYRGDSAFCSLECREQQMKKDEGKEKCSLASKMEAAITTTGPEVQPAPETVAAV